MVERYEFNDNTIIEAYYYPKQEHITAKGQKILFQEYPHYYVLNPGSNEQAFFDQNADGLNGNERLSKKPQTQ